MKYFLGLFTSTFLLIFLSINLLFLTSSFASPASARSISALGNQLKITAKARIRFEESANKDYLSSGPDRMTFMGSRFRLGFLFTPSENLGGFIQPQFTKIWGIDEYIASGVTGGTLTGSASGTSGALNNTGLDIHQAYIDLKGGNLSLRAGRQELIYGDHLLIGNVGWSNTARSFDALKGKYSYGSGSLDLIYSKIKERGASTSSISGDKDLYGVYNSFNLGPSIKDFDLYAFYQNDAQSASTLIVFGTRLKGKPGFLDFRTELTGESVSSTIEFQGDAELGLNIAPASKFRLALEYFHATAGYDQMYPTAHKWLGYGDFFKRKNIQGFRIGAQSNLASDLLAKLDLHYFMRSNTSLTGYNFGGAALGTTGTESAMATEIDVTLKYKSSDRITWMSGFALVLPGAYMKANKGGDMGHFYYLQVAATL